MTDMRRVAIPTYHPIDDQRVVWREAITLANEGFSVLVLGRGDVPNLDVAGVRVVSVTAQTTRTSLVGQMLYAFRVLKQALQSHPDALHLHDHSFLVASLFFRGARNCYCVFDRHEHYEERVLSRLKRFEWLQRTANRLFLRIERALLRRMDAIIVVSAEMANEISHRSLPPIRVVENSASERLFAKARSGDPAPRAPVIAHTGTLSVDRGSHDLIDLAFEIDSRPELAEFELHVYLRFLSDAHHDDFFAYLGTRGTPQCLRLLDPVPLDMLVQDLLAAQFGLSLLHPVGQYPKSTPTKLHEYLAAGLMPICYDLPASRDLLERAGVGDVVQDGDVFALANRLVFWSLNMESLDAHSKQAIDFFRDHLSWEANDALQLLDSHR
jgi:glycosyltransferase involved in cell wall biosynthesis